MILSPAHQPTRNPRGSAQATGVRAALATPTGHHLGAKSLIPKSEAKQTNHKQPG